VKRLYRSTQDRILGGVCGGLAEYFSIDPLIVRITWLVVVLIGGTGIIAYIIAVIIVPVNKGQNAVISTKPNVKPVIGILLILLGLIFLVKDFWLPFGWGWSSWFVGLPSLGLIVIGLLIILGARERRYIGDNKNYASYKYPRRDKTGFTTIEDENDSYNDSSSTQQLKRSRGERMLLGICGGIGIRYSIDPTLVRLVWIIMIILTSGMGLILYLLLYFIIPLESEKPAWQVVD